MASKRRLRRKECTKKIPMTADAAYALARELWTQGKRMHAYRCNFSGSHFHVGHF